MSDIALRTSETALISRLGAAEYERCVALQLTSNDMANLGDLTDMYEHSAGALVTLLETGLSLDHVYEALEVQQNHFPEEDAKNVARFVAILGFTKSTQLRHVNNENKEVQIAKPLGTEEAREREMLRALGIEPEEATRIKERAHRYESDSATSAQSDVMDTFADAVRDAGGRVTLTRLTKLLREDFAGDILRAYRIVLERPNDFNRFLRGEITIDALLRQDADTSQYLEDRARGDIFTGF